MRNHLAMPPSCPATQLAFATRPALVTRPASAARPALALATRPALALAARPALVTRPASAARPALAFATRPALAFATRPALASRLLSAALLVLAGAGCGSGSGAAAADAWAPSGDAGSPGGDGAIAPFCGDGTVDPGEVCDGDCPLTCDDFDGCTTDTLAGSAAQCTATCSHVVTITACESDDGCCAAGCDRNQDNDCPYYVDAIDGDDADDGLTPQTAWRTMVKVNAQPFVAGDRIAFRRGAVWREPLVITAAGTKDRPIVFGPYGSDPALPAIETSAVVSSWTPAGDSVYAADLATPARQVFVDGERLSIARHPNQGYLYADQDEVTASTSFLDNDLTATRDQLLGATVILRTVRWAYDARTIVDFADHRITIDSPVHSWGNIQQNSGYFLTNARWMLDAPGEWFYDATAGKLYVRLPGDADPAAHVVTVSTADNAIDARTARGLVIQGLEVRQAGQLGIHLTAPADVRVEGCVVGNSGNVGILVNWPPADAVVEIVDNVVRDSVVTGIAVSADDTRPAQVAVEGNRILDTMMVFPAVNVAAPHTWIGSGASISGQGNRFTRNVVIGSGYDGVSVAGVGQQIEQNFLQRCCLTLDDCGGIYLNGSGHQVRANIVVDMIGNPEGTPDFFTNQSTAAQGIYADAPTHDIRMEANTVINADWGFQIHDSYANQLLDNQVYGCRAAGLYFSEDDYVNQGFVHDNVTQGNTIFCSPGVPAVQEWGALGWLDFGTFDRNVYWHTQGEQPIQQSAIIDGQFVNQQYSLAAWREATGNDLESQDLADTYTVVPVVARPTGTTELITNGNFDAGIAGWSSWPAAVALTWDANAGMTGGCLGALNDPPASGALVSSPGFAVTRDQGYQVKFSVRAGAADVLSPVVRWAADPWTSVGFSQTVAVGDARTDFTFAFVATEDATARLDFGLAQAATQYYLDDVSIVAATLFANDPDDDARIVYNPTAEPISVDLQGQQLCAIDGSVVAGAIELGPYASRILLSCACNLDHQCNNLETNASCAADCP